MSPEERGDQAERLVGVALRMVAAVHEDGADQVERVLNETHPADLRALSVVLAAMVDPTRGVDELLAWVTWDEHGRQILDVSTMDEAQIQRLWALYRRGERTDLTRAGYREHERRRARTARAARRAFDDVSPEC